MFNKHFLINCTNNIHDITAGKKTLLSDHDTVLSQMRIRGISNPHTLLTSWIFTILTGLQLNMNSLDIWSSPRILHIKTNWFVMNGHGHCHKYMFIQHSTTVHEYGLTHLSKTIIGKIITTNKKKWTGKILPPVIFPPKLREKCYWRLRKAVEKRSIGRIKVTLRVLSFA